MKRTVSVLLCIIFLLSLTACNKSGSNSKKAVFEHINLEYDFIIPDDMSCVVDNNDKQTVWLYEKNGDPAEWEIIITLEPATYEEFESFDINQRAYIKNQTAQALDGGYYLYDYDIDEVVSEIYGIAEYNEKAECIIFLRAKNRVDKEIPKKLLSNATVTKTK